MRRRRGRSTETILGDPLGPRGRRRVLIASIVSGLALLAVIAVGVRRVAAEGQFRSALWEPLTDGSVLNFLLGGLLLTLRVAAVSMVLAMALGGILALIRLTRPRPARWSAAGFVEFFRAMPLILLIYFAGQGLPVYGIRLPAFWFLVIALVVYNGAVLAEIFRAGILSLDRGQTEAAYALGLRYWATMRLVLIPQALRRMVPAIVSQLVTLLKDTSLGFVIAYDDLLARAQQTGTFYGNQLQALTLAAVMYILVNLVLSRVARRLEVRQRRRYGADPIQVGGAEELAPIAVEPTGKA
jgi:glutamate transport system permease protein